MKKYNLAINILFWTLTAFISFIAVLSIVSPDIIENSLLFKKERKVVVKTEVEKEPMPMVVHVEKDVNWYYFVATGYSANDPAQGTNSTTATGTEVREGIVAVDPDVIPLGTEIEIKGLGTFVAEDTGGKINGNRIDVFFDSKQEAREFGRKEVWVQISDDSIEIAENLEQE